jgi:thymidylate synthase (FAD)
VDESQIGFVLPPEIEEGTPEFDEWARECESSLASYRRLLAAVTHKVSDDERVTMRKKRARQAARAVLPNSAETKIVVTGNARAWRHFCEMRGSSNADLEIRRLAGAVLRALQAEAPNIFGDMRFVPSPDGIDTIETDFSKV